MTPENSSKFEAKAVPFGILIEEIVPASEDVTAFLAGPFRDATAKDIGLDIMETILLPCSLEFDVNETQEQNETKRRRLCCIVARKDAGQESDAESCLASPAVERLRTFPQSLDSLY